MAGKKVERSDIVADGLFDNTKQSAKDAEAQVELFTQALDLLSKSAKTTKTSLQGITNPKTTADLKKQEALFKQADNASKARINLNKQLKASEDEVVKGKLRLQKASQDQRKALKDEILVGDKQLNTLEKLRARNSQLKRAKDQVNLSTKKGQARVKLINAELNRNNKILERNASALGKQKMGIGRYEKALGSLRGGLAKLGIAFGAFQLIRGLGEAVTTIKEFEQAQADLASVLGINVDQMGKLTEQAKQLGATTTFTAQNVLELQKEFAKLGFTEQEILNVTEATLLLAEATGTELGRAAEVTGATIRAFGLDSTETQRVVDVMAKSFSSSSLDMEKFATAMGSIAPVAANMGFSIEETTALIGTLTDRGIDASTAGTGLRNMMLDATKKGLTFQEALDKVNNASDKTAKAFELFGKRGATVGVVLASNQKATALLTEKLLDADGAAKQMADTQRNTLGGSLELLKSAWDGIILSMNEAGGVGEKLRGVIVFLSENLTTIMKVLWEVVKAVTAYKVALIGLKLAEKIRDQRAFSKALKSGAVSADSASKGIKKFGQNLKAIGWAVAISALLKLATSFWSAVGGANALIRASEKMAGAIAGSTASANNFLDALKKKEDEAMTALDNRRKLNQLSAKELLEEKAKVIKATENELNSAIDSVDKRRNANLKLWVEQRRQLKELGEGTAGFQANLSSAELADAWGIGTILPKAKQEILDLVKAQETLKARIEAGEEKITIYKQALGQTGLELVNATVDVEAYGLETDETTGKVKKAKKAQDDLNDSLERAIELEEAIRNLETKQFDANIADIQKDITNELEKQVALTESSGKFDTTKLNEQFKQVSDLQKTESINVRDFEILLAEQTIEDKQLLAVRLEEIEFDHQGRMIEIMSTETDARTDAIDKLILAQTKFNEAQDTSLEDEKKRLEKRKEIANRQKEILKGLADYFIEQEDRKLAKIDEEIEAHEHQISMFEEGVAQGNISAKESLAEEKILADEAKAERERIEKEKQTILMVTSILEAYNSALANGATPQEAFTQAITSQALLQTFLSTIGSFYDGTEDTGIVGNPLDSNGGRLALLHNNERVMTAKQNAKLGGYSNEEVARIVERQRLGNFQSAEQLGQGYESLKIVEELMSVGSKVEKVAKAIENQEKFNFEIMELTQYSMKIIETRKKGNRTTRRIAKVQG